MMLQTITDMEEPVPAHFAKPSQLRDDYEDMLAELVTLLGPHLPAETRIRALTRAMDFGQRLSDYADIDALIGALRRNGLPDSRRHRVYQLVVDYIKTNEARGDAA